MGLNIFTFADSCNITNCSVCKSRSLSCSVCNDGYATQYVDSSRSYECKACKDPNCVTCYSSSYAPPNPFLCRVCKLGWSLDYSASLGCYNISILNCKRHWNSSSSGKTYCAECNFGYIRTSGYDKCLTCTVSNCLTCVVGNGSSCATCATGYYGSLCKPNCTLHCAAGCSSPYNCTKCDAGYSGSDCSIVSCNVSNCDYGCTNPDICDICDPGFSGPQCTTI